jgi:hypothetical protein
VPAAAPRGNAMKSSNMPPRITPTAPVALMTNDRAA